LVDTAGELLALVIHTTNIQDRDGAKLLSVRLAAVLAYAHKEFGRMGLTKKSWSAGGMFAVTRI